MPDLHCAFVRTCEKGSSEIEIAFERVEVGSGAVPKFALLRGAIAREGLLSLELRSRELKWVEVLCQSLLCGLRRICERGSSEIGTAFERVEVGEVLCQRSALAREGLLRLGLAYARMEKV